MSALLSGTHPLEFPHKKRINIECTCVQPPFPLQANSLSLNFIFSFHTTYATFITQVCGLKNNEYLAGSVLHQSWHRRSQAWDKNSTLEKAIFGAHREAHMEESVWWKEGSTRFEFLETTSISGCCDQTILLGVNLRYGCTYFLSLCIYWPVNMERCLSIDFQL